jgi:hypothetical protein
MLYTTTAEQQQQNRRSRQMFYVYCKHVKTGKEDFVNCYETAQQAIEKIASNYNIDKRMHQLGEYYYFMKQR